MKAYPRSLQFKFLLGIVLVVVPVLGVIFTYAGIRNEKEAMGQVVTQARILARQVVLTRKWISDCGGILVHADSQGAKDTTCFFDDRVKTPRGPYQRFTPAMVTRKLSQYSEQENLYRFRLASLNPLNPENRATDFEKEALNRFSAGNVPEMFYLNNQPDEEYLHYIVPLHMERGCIKCHSGQSASAGPFKGGLSVILPLEKLKHSVGQTHLKLAGAGGALILLTIFTLFILMRWFVIKPLKKLKIATEEIGRGHLQTRVHIRTGDEFEKLGDMFNTMAQRIEDGRDQLEERITQATEELKEANRELKTLDQLKSDFLATMSHELRSPLTVIRGGVDYLERKLQGEDNRNYLQIIDKNVDRMIRLVSDVFDFAKLDARKTEWSFEAGNLSELVLEVVEIISPLAEEKRIGIQYEGPQEVRVNFDLERLEQVLVNLIDNSIKFSQPDTTIRIQVEEDRSETVVCIKDEGAGIAEGDLETIFDKFSTVPRGGDGSPEGTGLGLAICKAIVEAHGGRIWAQSRVAVGASFSFSLPR